MFAIDARFYRTRPPGRLPAFAASLEPAPHIRHNVPATMTKRHTSETDDIAELFRETGRGGIAAVQRMLHFRPQLARARDASGLSVLVFAQYMRQDAILELLLDSGPPLDIFEAAALDRDDVVSDLIVRDPSLETTHAAHGATALHDAAASGSVRAIPVLLAAGASIDAVSRDGRAATPLHAAAASGGVEACRLLLRAGADPNARRADGMSPLMIAAAANDRELAELLVARNANVDLRHEHDGATAADIAVRAGNLALAARLRLDARFIDRRTT